MVTTPRVPIYRSINNHTYIYKWRAISSKYISDQMRWNILRLVVFFFVYMSSSFGSQSHSGLSTHQSPDHRFVSAKCDNRRLNEYESADNVCWCRLQAIDWSIYRQMIRGRFVHHHQCIHECVSSGKIPWEWNISMYFNNSNSHFQIHFKSNENTLSRGHATHSI